MEIINIYLIFHRSYCLNWSLIILCDGPLIILNLLIMLTPFVFGSFDRYTNTIKYIIMIDDILSVNVMNISYDWYNCTFQSILSVMLFEIVTS